MRRMIARLIAAAPDLLEALRRLCDDVETALPAIRSAESVAFVHGMHSPYEGKSLPDAVSEARAAIAKATGEGA